jgi:hypothetical protein
MPSVISKGTYNNMGDLKRCRPTLKLLAAIALGEFDTNATTAIYHYGEWYEMIVGIGKDYNAVVYVDGQTVDDNPDYFEKVK